ncbi:MAG: hypothetical protein ACKOWE_05215 [Micrococcales bacterium]
MKRIIWFAVGISLGYVVAKQLEENPQAQAIRDDVQRRAKDFGAAVSEGFREREAELAGASAKPVAAKKPAARKPAAKKPAAKKPAAK